MEAVVEFHGFKDNHNRFIVKELAVVSKYIKSQIVFQAPFSKSLLNSKMTRTANWLSNSFHSIDWNDGDIPYDESLICSLCKPFDIIYTKGLEKVTFLQQFHSNVKEITINSTRECCSNCCVLPQHRNNSNVKCALASATCFYKSLIKQLETFSRQSATDLYDGRCLDLALA